MYQIKTALTIIATGTFIFLLGSSPAPALDPSLDISQYAHKSWTVEDGSLKGGVRCITQTPDGYLWLGTEFGLLRFDGVRFVPWSPPTGQQLPSNNIRSLVGARDGTLWIGTLEGLVSWKDGKLTSFPEFAQQNVLTLLEDREGTVWAGTFQVPKGKLCAIHHGSVECYGDDGSLGQWAWSVYEDREGQIWVGAETGLWRWKPGPPKRYVLPHAIETSQALVEGPDRSGLLAIAEDVWQLEDGTTRPYRMATPPGRLTPMRMLRDRDGGLWLGTLQRGLLHLHQGRTSVFGQSDGLSSDHTLSLFEDREGNIWVGTADGLDRFRQTSVYSVSVKQGISNPSVEAVLVAHDNSIWLSTLDGLNRWKDGRVTIFWAGGRGAKQSAHLRADQQTRSVFYPAGEKEAVIERVDPGLPDDAVGSLYEDERQRLWVSTPREVARFENGTFNVIKEVPAGWVNAITGDANGGVWISYQDHGLVHWVDGKVVETVPWSKLGGNVIASSVAHDPARGGLWLGFFQGGLVHFKDGQVRESYSKTEGLGRGRVMGLQLDRDGAVWAATEGGLSHVKDGNILTLNSSNGLPCDIVHWAVEVDASFWLYTACGLIRIPKSELDNWTADPRRSIQFTVLDRSEGVRIRTLLTGYTPRVSVSGDGRLWFADLESLSMVDPHHLVINNAVPAVHIEQIIADNKVYEPLGRLQLRPRVHDLTIDYTALSFAAPEKVRFRYKLDGQDRDWREVVNDRKVQYSNLAPRSYTFRVLACNESGVWNEEGASLEFVIPPAWYQTNWFWAGCFAAILTIIWAGHRLRVRQLAAQFNMRLEERVGERTRIARDLHDTLLQSFQGLVFRFQAARFQLPQHPQEASETLDDALVSADQALADGRSAIQELRSRALNDSNLEQMLLGTGRELSSLPNGGGSVPLLRVIVQGRRRPKRPIVKEEIYRIARELLRNAYRHAHAHSIEAELRYDDDAFLLIVRDDGKGIDPKVLKDRGRAGHWGLPGMYERAEGIGARLDIWSEAGAGTEVRVTVPSAIAYEKTGEGFRFKLFRKTKIYEHRS
ncbi:MAG TPA: two-component regulator propeller domain-containing protein [Dongiaceae bacterium]|nr:two-component regulator propeller domain-containing protein [Dongiaceae bacterium]